jgi:diguanylate cyclase (GGDEF)-like protein/PAS domain S-box-containing protein
MNPPNGAIPRNRDGNRDYLATFADRPSTAAIVCIGLLVIVILAIGLATLLDYRSTARRDVQGALEAVARLKAIQVESWRTAVENAALTLSDAVARSRASVEGASIDARFHGLVDSNVRELGIGTLAIVTPDGRSVVGTDDRTRLIMRSNAGLLRSALDATRPVWIETRLSDDAPTFLIHVVMRLPASAASADTEPLLLVLSVDPDVFLLPFIQDWPNESPSAETILFRERGETIVYLNSLRHSTEGPMSTRFRATADRLLAAQVVTGHLGALEGVDYRGVEVVGFGRHIGDSPWYLVAKVDAHELYRHVERNTYRILALTVALVLTSLLATRLWWKRIADRRLRLYSAIFENTSEAVLVTDSSGRIIAVNSSFTEITGYQADDVMGQAPSVLSSGKQDQSFYRAMWEVLKKNDRWSGEIWNRRKDGTIYPQWQSITAIRDKSERIANYVAIFSDISDRKSAEERITFLAYHDTLTGLPNRALMRDRLSQAMHNAQRHGTRTAVMMVDVDHFKTINDSLGHPAGDELICSVANRLKSVLRSEDTVCRLGGDEFLVILPAIERVEDVAEIVSRAQRSCREPTSLGGHEIHITLSMGVCLFPDDGLEVDTLIRNADTALYQAKTGGRNAYRFFTPRMNELAVSRLTLEAEIRSALARDEFELHYQVQADAQRATIIGVEALVRWRHPTRGMVSPAQFIPIAEESGLIVPLGEQILRKACAQRVRWHELGFADFPVSVNVSATQLRDEGFHAALHRILVDTRLDPALLDIELTETAVMKATSEGVAMLHKLKELGVQLSIDDFGTGYSSLAYLKQFPVDRLKIDQSFVHNILHDRSDMAIVEAIIALGRSLHLRVIAEGVESHEQLARLLAYGCDEIQGYLIARPMPVVDLDRAFADGGLQRHLAGLAASAESANQTSYASTRARRRQYA